MAAKYDIIIEQGGFVDKFVGDEIIGLFGAPIPIDDAPFKDDMVHESAKHALEQRKKYATWLDAEDAVVVANGAFNTFSNNTIDGLWITTRNASPSRGCA